MTAQKREPINNLAQALEENGKVTTLAGLNTQEVKTEGEVIDAAPSVDLENPQADIYAEIRAEIEAASKKEKPKNKSMTFLITPDNAEQLEKLNVKGQKSGLVNKLLASFFENN